MTNFSGLRFVFSIMNKFLPSKIISTFFGLGYLPTWQHYWTAAGAIVLLYLVMFFRGDFFVYSADIITLMPETGFVALVLGVLLLVLGMLCIFSFHTIRPSAASSTEIMIHVAVFQILFVAFGMPVTNSVAKSIYSAYDFVCIDVIPCSWWILSSIKFFTGAAIPFVFFVIILTISPWPSVIIQLRYNNALSIMFEGLIFFVYTMLAAYFIAFTFFGTNLVESAKMLGMIFNAGGAHSVH